jgi:hypothetical protein
LQSLLKYFVTILFILIVGIQTFSKWVIILSYEINKDYITKNLCVNRNIPSSTCNGKCYLKKKLAADEDQQQPTGKPSFEKDIQLQLFLNNYVQPEFSINQLVIHHNSFYNDGKAQDFIDSFFQPPQCA